MKKLFSPLLAIFLLFSASIRAEEVKQFPNITGSVLFQAEADRVLSSKKTSVSPNNAFFYVEPKINLNFNRNWAIKTDWRLQPNDVFTTRDQVNPERYRTFLSTDRGLGLHEPALLIEEIKVQFENEDMKFFAGKFDPGFGTANNKTKRIGVFTSQFTEDYNLREKIGAGISALLENSKVTVNTFFNDTTGLSESALNNRGRADRKNGQAGNTGTLSSYSILMSGQNFVGIDDWIYNIGYRSLGVDNIAGRKREKGYVFGTEYAYQIAENTTLIPFFEAVKINNFTGEEGRNAIYSTTALIAKYSSWTASVAILTRNIKQRQRTYNISDNQMQLSVGYKFTDNLTLDVTRSNLKEDGYKASLIGAQVSYLYKF